MNDFIRRRKIIAGEAADWLIANRDELDPQQRKKLDDWLRASRGHVKEYLTVAQAAEDLGKASAASELSLDELLARARAEPPEQEDGGEDDDEDETANGVRRWHALRGTLRLAVAAAAAILVAVMGLEFLAPNPPHTASVTAAVSTLQISTHRGEQTSRRLDDGTVIRLNTDTAVSIAYARNARTVHLEHGQAVFEVEHDASRPFHVIAGAAEIVDLGTKFDVYVQNDATQVTVLEGEVSVHSAGKEPQAEQLMLTVGQQVRVGLDGGAGAVSRVDARRATAWMKHQIAFEHMPLGAVVQEFNRYNKTPLEIVTPELRTLEISGVFAQDDVESFVEFLRSLNGVEVEVREDRIRVHRR